MTTMNQQLTVECAPFKVLENVTESQLLEAAEAIERDFLSQQNGYVKRELLKGASGVWVDFIHWESPEHAQEAMSKANESSVCGAYFSLMAETETAIAGMSHFTQAGSWSK